MKKQDENIEQPVVTEEKVIDEVKPEEVVEEETEIEDLDENYLEDPLYMTIEEKRKDFDKVYKKGKILGAIYIIACVAVCCVCFVFVFQAPLIALPIMVVALFVAYILSSTSRKKVEKASVIYIREYFDLIKDYTFGNNMLFTDVETLKDQTIKPEQFGQGGFVQNVVKVGSRNMVVGCIDSYNFESIDCAARVRNGNVEETAFLGRYFMIQRDGAFDGKTLIYVAPKKNDGSGPNDLDDLNEIKNSTIPARIRVWTSDKNYKSIVSANVLSAIEQFEPNKVLEDVCICMKSNAIYVALSYSEDAISLPIGKEFKMRYFAQYKSDVAKLANVIKELRKNINKGLSKKKPASTKETQEVVEEVKEEEAIKEDK